MYFFQLCNIAKIQDEKALMALLQSGVLIDAGEGVHTPASFLAYQGDRTGAEFLRQHGADIHWIAKGAAAGGHIDHWKSLIQEGADIQWVVYGAAIGHYDKHLKYLQDHYNVAKADIDAIDRTPVNAYLEDHYESLHLKGEKMLQLIEVVEVNGLIDCANRLKEKLLVQVRMKSADRKKYEAAETLMQLANGQPKDTEESHQANIEKSAKSLVRYQFLYQKPITLEDDCHQENSSVNQNI